MATTTTTTTTTRAGTKRWWLVLLGIGLAACGGGAKEAVRGGALAPTSPYASSAPPSAAEVGEGIRAEPSAPSGASADSRAFEEASPAQGRAPAPPVEERPGLGTEWGETVRSRVRDVAFVRDGEDRPFSRATFRYDDRDGVSALLSAARGARGRERWGSADLDAASGAVTVSLRDEDGEALDAAHVGSETFVVGRSGARYAIVLTNHTRHRYEAVVTVDGLDVVNGRPGSLRHRGYLLMPFASVAIDGFRRSQDAVAAFRFASVRDAYAAKTGSGRDIGVIGAALFAERGDAFEEGSAADDEARLRRTASPFPAGRFARAPRR